MKKWVYVIREENRGADSFDLRYTFDIEEARSWLKWEADRGYRIEKKNPNKTTYWIEGYNVDTEKIEEEYDEKNAESFYKAYILSICFCDCDFSEKHEVNDI